MISVLLVDDHDIVRAGVHRLLSDTDDINVVAQANSGEEAVRLAKEKKPQVVLMDVRMPGIGGLEATKKMIYNDPNLKIIALTVCEDEPYPSKLLQAGASGYITKESSMDEMILAIRTVAAGKKYIGSGIAQQLALKSVGEDESLLDQLSDRELQVMTMITQGQKVQEISDTLCLSPKTINSYRYRIFNKLGVNSDVELTHLAIRYKILYAETAESE